MVPVGVRARVEFLSPGWLEAARQFLADEVPTRPELADASFSLCESFGDAPPSVAGPDGRAAWHLRIGDGRVTAELGDRPGTDVRIEGDYQTVLAVAQVVHAAGRDAVARAHREARHRAGGRPLRVTGAVHDPALLRLLDDLHDHLAARTVENPDLDHRVHRLGLQRHVTELAEQGYTTIERAVSDAMADELREVVEREVRTHHPFTTNGLLLRHRLFEEVALHPLACAAAESVVGQGMVLGAMSGTYKEAGPGAIDIHADHPLIREPYPDYGLICVACWALDDWTEEAGPTWVIPGSHRHKRAPRRDEPRHGAVPITMPKGSIALWGNGVWHWQGDRSLPGARVAIHVTYNRVFVRPLDDLSALGADVHARNPPAFATLLGLDDPFGKSSYTGHDRDRFAYAARALRS
jgi:ectoine hydroxylase-related dioxygenase (phytanoyl-CoA dioxygenase family)